MNRSSLLRASSPYVIASGGSERRSRKQAEEAMLTAQHMCMSMRGVQKHGSQTLTTQFSGRFLGDAGEQARFMTLVGGV